MIYMIDFEIIPSDIENISILLLPQFDISHNNYSVVLQNVCTFKLLNAEKFQNWFPGPFLHVTLLIGCESASPTQHCIHTHFSIQQYLFLYKCTMDFAYDKLQSGQEDVTITKPESDTQNSSLDKAADRLELEIEKAYETVAKASWGSIWSKVKQTGEAALKETRKDLEAVQKEIGTLLSDQGRPLEVEDGNGTAQASPSTANLEGSVETVKQPNASGSGQATMLEELTKRAQLYIDELDRDLEKIENTAGSYVSRFGKDLKTFLKDAVTVDGPDDSKSSSSDSTSETGEDLPSELLFNVPEDIRNQIYSTRLDAQLYALHTSPEPFLTETADPGYTAFAGMFDVNAHTDTIAKDLEEQSKLRNLMESLVPEKVPYDTFWTKYYYMKQQIEDQEHKRKLLVLQATNNATDIAWDDEDDEEDESGPRAEPKALEKAEEEEAKPDSSRPSSESSYDIISKSSSAFGSHADLKSSSPSKANDGDEDDWE